MCNCDPQKIDHVTKILIYNLTIINFTKQVVSWSALQFGKSRTIKFKIFLTSPLSFFKMTFYNS